MRKAGDRAGGPGESGDDSLTRHSAGPFPDRGRQRCPLSLIHICKSAVINLHRIRSLKSRTGGRIEASLENGERLVVSRHYAPLLRERLGL